MGGYPKPTIKERILEYLSQHPEGATDGELTIALNIKYHAQTNDRCHKLEETGLIERRQVGGKMRNYLVGTAGQNQEPAVPISAGEQPFFWEGNVQSNVVSHLVICGYRIVRCADTASREQGKDIVADNAQGELWVTVKGYPKGTERTQPSTQAGHWFKQGFFDIVAWRSEDREVKIALALPDFSRYRKLTEKVRWLMPIVPFHLLWLHQSGCVEEDHSTGV